MKTKTKKIVDTISHSVYYSKFDKVFDRIEKSKIALSFDSISNDDDKNKETSIERTHNVLHHTHRLCSTLTISRFWMLDIEDDGGIKASIFYGANFSPVPGFGCGSEFRRAEKLFPSIATVTEMFRWFKTEGY